MSRKRRKTESAYRQVTIAEVIAFVIGKEFHSAGTVVNVNDEEIGVSFIFFEKGKPEELAAHWSIHCKTDGTFWIAEW